MKQLPEDKMDLVQQAPQPVEIANAVTFHGTIISDIMDVGEGFSALNIEGPKKEEMPLILIIGDAKDISQVLFKNDKIMGVGTLEKVQGEWLIVAGEIHKNEDQKKI